MSSRFPPFFSLLLVLFSTNISEGEEEVEDMLIKICSTQVWRERNYTRGQDYMRLFHHLKTCFEIQHCQKYSYYRHTGTTVQREVGENCSDCSATALQRKIRGVADCKGSMPWWSHVMKAEQAGINKYRSPHPLQYVIVLLCSALQLLG